MNTLRIAAVGGGYFSQFHYDAWRRLPVDLVGVCDLDINRAQQIAADFESAEAFDDAVAMLDTLRPDLLDVIVPPAAQVPIVEAAIDAGVAIVCQKPFTPDIASAIALTQRAHDAGVMLAVHENFRFEPWHQAIYDLLQHDAIGTIYQISFRLRPGDGQGADAYLARQPYFQRMPRFLMRETGIHLIDVFRYLFGEVDQVMGWLTRLNPHIDGEDSGVVLFKFANGVRGVFDGNRLVDHVAVNRRQTMGDMLIEGERGVIRLDGDGRVWLRKHAENEEQRIEFDWQDRGFAGDSVYRYQAHVLAHLREGKPLANGARDYLRNMQLVEAVYRSAELGTWITP
ncbi:MAG: putative dehydrogenase [Gammaproteobacteria bacterium]|jgi:predicted dehydrogenase